MINQIQIGDLVNYTGDVYDLSDQIGKVLNIYRSTDEASWARVKFNWRIEECYLYNLKVVYSAGIS